MIIIILTIPTSVDVACSCIIIFVRLIDVRMYGMPSLTEVRKSACTFELFRLMTRHEDAVNFLGAYQLFVVDNLDIIHI